MKIYLKTQIGNAIHVIEKIEFKYIAKSQFIGDFNVEEFEFDTFEKAKDHVDTEIKHYNKSIKALKKLLEKALDISENLNLDLSSSIEEILETI